MNLFTLFSTRFEHLVDQRLPRELLQAKRIKKFRRLVAYAREHSPYYSRVIDENGIDPAHCHPEDFPVMTKRQLMDHFDQVVTDRRITKESIANFLETSKDPQDLFAGNFHVVHTSGSSGEKGFFIYSQKDWARGIAHALRLNNFSLKRQRMAFIGSTRGHFAGISFASSVHEPLINWFFRIQTYEINSPLGPIIDRLNTYQPDVLIGYATVLATLAEEQLKGSLKIRPSVVESGGEPLNPSEQSVIEAAFKVPILNLYMSSEHIYMGIGKPDYHGMYLLENDLIFEIHEDHTCVTNLFNYTLPLIRYRMEDILIPEADGDGILPFTKVKNIVGRNEHIPIFTNKHGVDDFISPHVISGFVVNHLRRFQLQVLDKKSFLLRVYLEEGLHETQKGEVLRKIKKRLTDMLSKKDFDNVSFEIQVVNDLPVDEKTGKFRLIIPQDDPMNGTSYIGKKAMGIHAALVSRPIMASVRAQPR